MDKGCIYHSERDKPVIGGIVCFLLLEKHVEAMMAVTLHRETFRRGAHSSLQGTCRQESGLSQC